MHARQYKIINYRSNLSSTTGKYEASQDITNWTFVELHSISNSLLRVCCSQGESVVSLAKDRSS